MQQLLLDLNLGWVEPLALPTPRPPRKPPRSRSRRAPLRVQVAQRMEMPNRRSTVAELNRELHELPRPGVT